MSDMPLFFPQTIYSNKKGPVPRVMIAPQRYIQGAGVLANTGKYLQLLGAKQVGILASTRGLNADAKTVIKSLREQGIEVHTAAFDGECSLQEIDTQVDAFSDKFVDCLIAIGGGNVSMQENVSPTDSASKLSSFPPLHPTMRPHLQYRFYTHRKAYPVVPNSFHRTPLWSLLILKSLPMHHRAILWRAWETQWQPGTRHGFA